MATATVTSKGQITIPAKVRDALGIESGDRVEFVPTETGGFVIIPANKSIEDLKGIIAKPSKPVSIECMNKAIARHWAGRR
ncbi:MAG: AbrB/MazE/SpoVT family DNA-binding domain-containing protein [Terriglobales bacterium]|jgi:antitoxin PrlF